MLCTMTRKHVVTGRLCVYGLLISRDCVLLYRLRVRNRIRGSVVYTLTKRGCILRPNVGEAPVGIVEPVCVCDQCQREQSVDHVTDRREIVALREQDIL